LLEVLQAGGGGKKNGDGTRADFFLPPVSGVSTTRFRTRDLRLGQKPHASGLDPTPSLDDLPGNFSLD
jgi:hypothetical protein